MSKICERKYSENSMYTLKMIDGVGCCPNCDKAAYVHNSDLRVRLIHWAFSKDVGVSSKALAKHMNGDPATDMMPPSDASDRARCIKLLELIPEWLPRLDEMKKYDVENKPEGITIGGSGITAYDNSWSKQIPLIAKEGNFYAGTNSTTNPA